jgi:hypothetical protein
VVSVDRAQAHTLEAFVAALLLVAGLIFAAQATAVTPLSASTSNQYIENQHRALAGDLLSTAAEDGSLGEAVVYWNWYEGESAEEGEEVETGFVGSGTERDYYTATPTGEHPLAPALEIFDDNYLAYNVDLVYRDGEGGTDEIRMVEMGSPSDNAVAVTRSVVLYDSTELSPNEEGDRETLSEGDFYAPNVDPDGQLYNVVEVRIVVWWL